MQKSSHGDDVAYAKDMHNRSYAIAYGYGAVIGGIAAKKGERASPEQLDADAYQCVAYMKATENRDWSDAITTGFKQGYNDSWVDSKRAADEATRLLRESNPPSTESSTQSQQPHVPTKQEWKASVPQNPGLVAFGRIACGKQVLFDAVGQPSRTQEVGDEEYLYWDCTDGQIQVICARGQYELGQVGGNVNEE